MKQQKFLRGILLFFTLNLIGNCDFIDAQDKNFPVRSGTLHVFFEGAPKSGLIRVNYNQLLLQIPTGIFVAIRSIQFDDNNLRLDYSLTPSSISLSYFNLQYVLEEQHGLSYTNLMVNYLGMGASTDSLIITKVTGASQSLNHDTSGYMLIYLFNVPINFTNSLFSITDIIASFPLTYSYYQNVISRSDTSIVASFIFPPSSIVTKLIFSMLLINDIPPQYSEYIMNDEFLNITTQTQNRDGYEMASINKFYVLNFIYSAIPKPIKFTITFVPWQIQDTQRYYLAQNFIQYIEIKQIGPIDEINFNQFSYDRVSCSSENDYKYLDFESQRCYDECPFGKYPDIMDICKNCTRHCSNIFDCQICYENGCKIGQFLEISVFPFTCQQCSFSLLNCKKCTQNHTHFLCTQCDSDLFQIIEGQCIQKSNTTMKDNCSQLTNCQVCSSDGKICLSCLVTSQSQLINGKCFECQFFFYFDSPTKSCKTCSYIPSQSQQMSNCQFQLFQTAQMILNATYFIISFPTSNLLSNAFIQLFATIDDLSYYPYHSYKYFELLLIQFEMVSDVAFHRFLPEYLTSMYEGYLDKTIVPQNNFQSPSTFKGKGENSYFLDNTLQVWIGYLPYSILIFIVFSLVHWFINKWIKNNTLKTYTYSGMIVVSILGGNVQNFAFRCFSNMYQSVPLNSLSYLNIIFCYIVLLLIVIYSVAGLNIFYIFYRDLKYQYLLSDLFQFTSYKNFVIYNVLKICTGFIHAYLIYQPLYQSILLLIAYIIRAFIALSIMRKVKGQKYFFVSQFIGEIFLFLMQLFILAQQLNLKYLIYNLNLFSRMGAIEVMLVFFMIINKIILVAVDLLKSLIFVLMKIFHKKPRKKISINKKPLKMIIIKTVPDQLSLVYSNNKQLPLIQKIKNRTKLNKIQNQNPFQKTKFKTNTLKQNY